MRQIVSFGPHPPGSEAQRKVGGYIAGQLNQLGLRVDFDVFQAATPEGRIEMKNIRGTLMGPRSDVIIIASHYDSKLFKSFEFVGANDSGSSSGVVLELARAIKEQNPTRYSFWFVFFDGEEAFRQWTDLDSLYGSRHYVRILKRNRTLSDVKTMILLDLIGGKDLSIERDINSDEWLNRIVWETASELGASSIFKDTGTTNAIDDHTPFKESGIPVIDIIDLKYSEWHQPGDTLDKLSEDNMAAVGNVVYASLAKITEYLDSP